MSVEKVKKFELGTFYAMCLFGGMSLVYMFMEQEILSMVAAVIFIVAALAFVALGLLHPKLVNEKPKRKGTFLRLEDGERVEVIEDGVTMQEKKKRSE